MTVEATFLNYVIAGVMGLGGVWAIVAGLPLQAFVLGIAMTFNLCVGLYVDSARR